MRVVELFCGMGGCAAALGTSAEVVAAVDINRKALHVYAENFRHPIHVRAIESLAAQQLAAWNAELWWMSPPCQPYTVRGRQRDIEDPRAASFLALLQLIPRIRPRNLAMENVPGFYGSQAHARLREMLTKCGYTTREILLCPTQLGIPNRRCRYYCVASLDQLHDWPALDERRTPIFWAEVLDLCEHTELQVPGDLMAAYTGAVHVVDPNDASAVSCCFTSSYGRSVAASGSYLKIADIYRRFSPPEILRLLGFPADFQFPASMETRDAWRLLGNSLSVPAVRYVLSCIPAIIDAPCSNEQL